MSPAISRRTESGLQLAARWFRRDRDIHCPGAGCVCERPTVGRSDIRAIRTARAVISGACRPTGPRRTALAGGSYTNATVVYLRRAVYRVRVDESADPKSPAKPDGPARRLVLSPDGGDHRLAQERRRALSSTRTATSSSDREWTMRGTHFVLPALSDSADWLVDIGEPNTTSLGRGFSHHFMQQSRSTAKQLTVILDWRSLLK